MSAVPFEGELLILCFFVRRQPATASAGVQSATQFPSRSISSPARGVNSTKTVRRGTPSSSTQTSTIARPKAQPPFRRATATKLDHDHGDGLEAVGTEVIEIFVAELRDPDVRSPQLRLHEIRVQFAKACCQFALYLDGIGAGQIKMQVRHENPPSGELASWYVSGRRSRRRRQQACLRHKSRRRTCRWPMARTS